MTSSFLKSIPNIEEKNYNKSPKIYIGESLYLYFDQKLRNISLSPILPINDVDYLFKLYKLKLTKQDLLKRIIALLNGENLNEKQKEKYTQNGIKFLKVKNQIKIIDDIFIKDCIILSKTNLESSYIIADRISKAIYKESIKYKYLKNEADKKSVIAYLKYKDNIYIQSDYVGNDKEAKLDVNKKIIIKYLPKKISKEIINNINECIKNESKIKEKKKEIYENYYIHGKDKTKLLNNKRKITLDEFSKRLPYFNMLEKKKKLINNDLIEEDENVMSFTSNGNYPINEILLGDLSIIYYHLKDFKYTPLKIFEMIRDSEKKRGVDFKIEYSQINDKKNNINNREVTIISHKLGIKVKEFGKSKEEAENKCALNLLFILFKDKFKTYFELNDYFEHKNRKYLDIILNYENEEENQENKKRKIEEKNIHKNKDNIDIEMNYVKPIYFKNNNLTFDNSNNKSDTEQSLDNIKVGFGNLFNWNSNSNINDNNNSSDNSSINSSSNNMTYKINDNLCVKLENNSSSEEIKQFIKKENMSDES